MNSATTILSLLFCILWNLSVARIIPIGQHQKVQRISDGIVLARAGDTLLIESGTYREGNIILQKSVSLIGQDLPTLDGENQFENLTVHADHLTIQGLRFINTGVANISDLAAIKVLNSKFVNILDNQFENTFFGIYFANAEQCVIGHNRLHANAEAEHQVGNGIHLWKCNGMTVRDNEVKGHRDGIYFEFVTHSSITGNHSESNLRYGLHFMFSHNDEYRNNIFTNNGAGVAVMYTKGVKMIDNTFERNWGSSSYGLLLKEIRDSEVTGNRFLKNSVGIHMEGSSRIELKENLFSQNGYAIRLQASCDENVFSHNNFMANTFDLVTNGSLVLNTINANYWDKYEGYDLNRDKTGDVPFHPVSMYGMIIEQIPSAVLLWRSFLVLLLDRAEKAIPAMTPESLKDNSPSMKPYDLVFKHP